jgi:uroporphyrinogen-III synthase
VLLLRPEDRGADLASRLEAMGARVQRVPVIAFAPPSDPAAARRATADLGAYDLVIFTSPTGVDAADAFLRESGAPGFPAGLRAAAIGPATARGLRDRGVEPSFVAADSRSEGLAECLLDVGLATRRVLLVRPEVARDVLPEALARSGARVDAVAFYRTVPAVGARRAVEAIAAGGLDAVVFTSPSTVLFLLAAGEEAGLDAPRSLRRVGRVAIGPVTAQALAERGLEADAVADSPESASVADAVLRALRGERAV